MLSRRRVWLPLLFGLIALIACGLSAFRFIGPWELAVVLVPLALIVLIESGRYIIGQFLKGYRRKSPDA